MEAFNKAMWVCKVMRDRTTQQLEAMDATAEVEHTRQWLALWKGLEALREQQEQRTADSRREQGERFKHLAEELESIQKEALDEVAAVVADLHQKQCALAQATSAPVTRMYQLESELAKAKEQTTARERELEGKHQMYIDKLMDRINDADQQKKELRSKYKRLQYEYADLRKECKRLQTVKSGALKVYKRAQELHRDKDKSESASKKKMTDITPLRADKPAGPTSRGAETTPLSAHRKSLKTRPPDREAVRYSKGTRSNASTPIRAPSTNILTSPSLAKHLAKQTLYFKPRQMVRATTEMPLHQPSVLVPQSPTPVLVQYTSTGPSAQSQLTQLDPPPPKSQTLVFDNTNEDRNDKNMKPQSPLSAGLPPALQLRSAMRDAPRTSGKCPTSQKKVVFDRPPTKERRMEATAIRLDFTMVTRPEPSVASTTKISSPAAQSSSSHEAADRPSRLSTGPVPPKPPGAGQQPGHVYEEVVRTKAARARLKGFACAQCRAFYEASGMYPSEECIHQHIQNTSRHRRAHEKEETPPHFWSPGFPPTQNSPSQTHNSTTASTSDA